MAYIIIGLMICVFSIGLLSSDYSTWGWVGIALGGFLILKGRGKSGLDE
jgi:hypothetical protein